MSAAGMEGLAPFDIYVAVQHVAQRDFGADKHTFISEGRKFVGNNLQRLNRLTKEGMHEIYENLSGILYTMTGPGVFVFSKEHLFGMNEVSILAFDKYLSKFFEDRTYVVYIRDTIDQFQSLYSEKLRLNNTHSCFRIWMRDKAKNRNFPNSTGKFHRLFLWDRLVGNRLNVRLLEPDCLKNGDLIEDFASVVRVAPYHKPPRMNESFSALYIEYIRFLNRELGHDLPKETRRSALRILTSASAGKPKLSLPDEQAESIQAVYKEQEEKIRERFFPNRHTLFSRKFRGEGIMPVPLTNRLKEAIEFKLREKMTAMEWETLSRALRKRDPSSTIPKA